MSCILSHSASNALDFGLKIYKELALYKEIQKITHPGTVVFIDGAVGSPGNAGLGDFGSAVDKFRNCRPNRVAPVIALRP